MSIRLVLAAPLVLSLSACAPAAPPATPRVVVLADAIETAAHDEWHYAPVVRSGDLVVLSGIPAGRGATDEEKIRNAFARAGRALAAAGATFDDVMEITTFHPLRPTTTSSGPSPRSPRSTRRSSTRPIRPGPPSATRRS